MGSSMIPAIPLPPMIPEARADSTRFITIRTTTAQLPTAARAVIMAGALMAAGSAAAITGVDLMAAGAGADTINFISSRPEYRRRWF
jgi:hypothetical protein